MKIIIGLGNIGPKYEQTRHNIGFMAVDQYAAAHQVSFTPSKFFATTAKIMVNGEAVLLVKPTTYMNESGKAARALVDYYQVPLEDVLVLVDDMDMALGKLRFRDKGSAGGHNGLKSLFAHLGTQNIWRLKLGIGHPEHEHGAVIDYVLGRFTAQEMMTVTPQLDKTMQALDAWIQAPTPDVGQLGNRFNG